MLTIPTDNIGRIVLIGRAKTGVAYWNQVNGVACSSPRVEGYIALVLEYGQSLGEEDNTPEIFRPHPKHSDKPLPHDYHEQVRVAVMNHFESHLAAFECTALPSPRYGTDFDREDCEAWVQVRFQFPNDDEWHAGVLTWPNSD